MSLKDQAIIVGVKISKWSGRKYDTKATSEVNAAHGTKNAGRFNKILIDEKAIGAITQAEGRIRTFQNENTLPWGDNGDRVLPATHYFAYTSGLKPLIDEFDSQVKTFVADYQDLIDGEIASRFGVKLSFQPMPDTEDFRITWTELNSSMKCSFRMELHTCSICGGFDIESCMWVNLNGKFVVDYTFDRDHIYCPTCSELKGADVRVSTLTFDSQDELDAYQVTWKLKQI